MSNETDVRAKVIGIDEWLTVCVYVCARSVVETSIDMTLFDLVKSAASHTGHRASDSVYFY